MMIFCHFLSRVQQESQDHLDNRVSLGQMYVILNAIIQIYSLSRPLTLPLSLSLSLSHYVTLSHPVPLIPCLEESPTSPTSQHPA